MKYMSLLALCSLLVLIPACKKGNGCGTRCCPTTTTTTTSIYTTSEPSTIVQESTVVSARPQAALTDKEALEEAELEEVMTNK